MVVSTRSWCVVLMVVGVAATAGCGGDSGDDDDAEACATGTFLAGGSCQPWSSCAPGLYIATEGTATADRVCAGCPSGTFSAAPNATGCEEWATCASGTRVANTPSATVDRTCEACGADTFTSGVNQSTCLPHDACSAGTVQIAPGTATAGPTCDACEAGTYCEGGGAPAIACSGTTWDHDADPATACAEWTVCVAGQRVAADGDATTDRACATCELGTTSTVTNAQGCQQLEWVRTYDTAAFDVASSVAIDHDANVFIAGNSSVRSYAPDGALRWDHEVSASTIAVDSLGNVFVAGNGRVRAYGSNGAPRWDRAVNAGFVAVAPSGVVVSVGDLVRIYSAAGDLLDSYPFSVPSGITTRAIALGPDGVIYAAGRTGSGGTGAFWAVGVTGTTLWTTLTQERLSSIVRSPDDRLVLGGEFDYDVGVYASVFFTATTGGSRLGVVGYEQGVEGYVALDGQGRVLLANGSRVHAFSLANGAPLWDRSISPANSGIQAISIDRHGNVVVAGIGAFVERFVPPAP